MQRRTGRKEDILEGQARFSTSKIHAAHQPRDGTRLLTPVSTPQKPANLPKVSRRNPETLTRIVRKRGVAKCKGLQAVVNGQVNRGLRHGGTFDVGQWFSGAGDCTVRAGAVA